MTSELLAILIVAVIQIVALVTLGLMLREMRTKNAADAPIYLHDWRIADVIADMRRELRDHGSRQ